MISGELWASNFTEKRTLSLVLSWKFNGVLAILLSTFEQQFQILSVKAP